MARVGAGTGRRASPPCCWNSCARPSSSDDHFARALCHLKEGHIASAMKEFDDANRERPDGCTLAYLAFCQSLSGQHRTAAKLYEEAARNYGFAPAWVRNNRAHSLIQAGPTPDRLREARAEAAAALELDPRLRSARLNRADARFRLSMVEPDPLASDLECLEDIETVMRDPPYTPDLYVKAAAMTARFGGGREECCARAVGYLAEAVKLGRSPRSFGADPIFSKSLAGRADFQTVLKQTRSRAFPARPQPAHRLAASG